MTVTYTGEAWRGVLEQTRAYNRAPGEPYDMRPYWRA